MSASQPQIVQLSEWEERELPGLVLGDSDRELAARLVDQEGSRLVVEELRDGLRIRTSSWVGVVRLGGFEIRVTPKLVGGDAFLVDLVEETSGLEALKRTVGRRTLPPGGNNLFDLFAWLLAEACTEVLRAGILRDYVEEEDTLPVLRGRLRLDRQVRERFGQLDRLICRFDDLREDVLENQILAFALSFCAPRVANPIVSAHVRQLAAVFREACEGAVLGPDLLREEVTYNRLNDHYRAAHELARLLLGGFGPTEILSGGATRSFAFLIDMNLLFEKLVHRVVSHCLEGDQARVDYQRSERSIVWDVNRRSPYMRVIPDLVVQARHSPSGRLPIDAKYKLYDTRRVEPADVYQLFLYAFAFAPLDHPRTAVLIHPSEVADGTRSHLRVQATGLGDRADLHVIGLHVPTVLNELRSREETAVLTGLRASLGQLLDLRSTDARAA